MEIDKVHNDGSDRVYEHIRPSAGWIRYSESNTLVLDLPGFKDIEELNLDIGRDTGNLNISGERHVSGPKWIRFRRVFRIPENSSLDEVRAMLEEGVLYVTIPKTTTRVLIPLPPQQQQPPSPPQQQQQPPPPPQQQQQPPPPPPPPASSQVPEIRRTVTRKVTFKEPTKVESGKDSAETEEDDSPTAVVTLVPETVPKPGWGGLVQVLLEKKVALAFTVGVGVGAFLGFKFKPRENNRNSN
ncbi:hypothetical protein H6P81_005000 [Aristolochia fimbriata]|uniref:SHSP domain-containing protein n=1 Tax=Aristolochia fimbriata TaxID=158543 RepID=A0AAV7EW57_ARIFI|nr:hypothetical protein H6P81_005000 [Aristolochia fimbriata]